MRVRRITTTAAMTALLGAASLVFGGVAFAESSSQIDQTSTVEVTNTQDLSVNQQTTSSSTVDGVTTSVTTDASYSSASESKVDEATATTTPEQSVTTEASNLAATETTKETATNPPAQELVTAAISAAVQKSVDTNNANNNYFQLSASDSSTSSGLTTTTGAPVGQAPAQPSSGALHQFDAVLATLISSTSRHMFDPNHADARLPMAAAAVLALFLVILAAPVVGQYVNRLRRAGYVHAARSDVAAAVSSFVTPTKVSFAWAASPAASSSFSSYPSWSVASGF